MELVIDVLIFDDNLRLIAHDRAINVDLQGGHIVSPSLVELPVGPSSSLNLETDGSRVAWFPTAAQQAARLSMLP
jgi:hypothetical protein